MNRRSKLWVPPHSEKAAADAVASSRGVSGEVTSEQFGGGDARRGEGATLMDALGRHLPGLTAPERAWLRGELLRRAAQDYQRLKHWREAAECRSEMGEHARAAQLYARAGDVAMQAAA